jgi:hypothetical protein
MTARWRQRAGVFDPRPPQDFPIASVAWVVLCRGSSPHLSGLSQRMHKENVMKTSIKALASCALLSSTSTALADAQPLRSSDGTQQADKAQGEPVTTGDVDHEGLMVRMSGGAAAFGAGFSPKGGAEFGVGAVGPALNLMVGKSIYPNLALHVDLLAIGSDSARVGADHRSDEFSADGVGLGAVGLGATYYVMPLDLALSGSLMVAAMGLEAKDGRTWETDGAMLMKLDVVKEWQVSRDWGLGLGLTAFAGGGEGDDDDGQHFEAGVGGASINLVATYF